ncbi:MAG: (deoxy)nucleoside triphosphate pyrophosphohydrolase [Rectinemataceae bacterium]
MERSVAGVLLRNGKVFVARRAPGGSMGRRWEFPGGKVEAGESDEEALEREFLEEFNAKVSARRLLGETSFLHHGVKRTLAAWLVELDPLSKLLPREHVELRWMSKAELRGLDFADSDRKLIDFVEGSI